jgi:hypothetical protein
VAALPWRRSGGSARAQLWPPAHGWRRGLAVGADGRILGLSRPKSDGPVVLRGIDPAGSQAEDLAEIAVPPSPSGATLAGRWDLEHAQLLLALPSGSLAITAPADYWLVRFAAGPGLEPAR